MPSRSSRRNASKMKMAAAATIGTVLSLATGSSAQGGAPHVPSDHVVPFSSSVGAPLASCSGSGTLPGDGPFCYHAKVGMLGVTENLDLKVSRTKGDFALVNGKLTESGTMDLVGSGVSPFTCKGIAITKDGQKVAVDNDALKKCLPRGVTLDSAQYCSDSNQVQVTISDSNIPIVGKHITKFADAVKCPSTSAATSALASVVNGLDGIKCKVCTVILNAVTQLIPVDAGKQAIEGALDKVCKKLGPIDQPCESFVSRETEAIVDGIMSKLQPEEICEKVHACDAL